MLSANKTHAANEPSSTTASTAVDTAHAFECESPRELEVKIASTMTEPLESTTTMSGSVNPTNAARVVAMVLLNVEVEVALLASAS